MCGIVAFTGKNNFDPIKIKTIFGFNQHRGFDSWGHCSSLPVDIENKKYRHVTQKKLGKVMDDMENLSLTPAQNFLGHVRAKTKGAVNIANAHPFQFSTPNGFLTGVHNGTVENSTDIERYLNKEVFTPEQKEGFAGNKTYAFFQVDSQMLMYSIITLNNYDILTKIDGGTALVFFVDSVLKVYTNGGRSLYQGETEEGTYFSSTETPLKVFGMENIKEVPLHTVLSYKNGKLLKEQKIAEPVAFKYSYVTPTVDAPHKNVEIEGFARNKFRNQFRFETTKKAIKDQCPEDKVPSVNLMKGDFFYDPVVKQWLSAHTNKPVSMDNIFVSKPFPLMLQGPKISDDTYHTEEHPNFFVSGFDIFEKQVRSKYFVDRPFYLDGNIPEENEMIHRNLIVNYWKGGKSLTEEKVKVDWSDNGTTISHPARKILYQNGLTCTVADNFNEAEENIISTFASFDPDSDKFVLWSIFEKGTTIEEEIVNIKDLFGFTVEEYKKKYPPSPVKKETDENIYNLCDNLLETITSIKSHNDDISKQNLTGMLGYIDVKPLEAVVDYLIIENET